MEKDVSSGFSRDRGREISHPTYLVSFWRISQRDPSLEISWEKKLGRNTNGEGSLSEIPPKVDEISSREISLLLSKEGERYLSQNSQLRILPDYSARFLPDFSAQDFPSQNPPRFLSSGFSQNPHPRILPRERDFSAQDSLRRETPRFLISLEDYPRVSSPDIFWEKANLGRDLDLSLGISLRNSLQKLT